MAKQQFVFHGTVTFRGAVFVVDGCETEAEARAKLAGNWEGVETTTAGAEMVDFEVGKLAS